MPLGRFSDKIYPGAKFNRLTVIERIPGGNGKRAKIRCLCDCGKEITPDCSNLANGNTKSCGCLNADKARELGKKHGPEAGRKNGGKRVRGPEYKWDSVVPGRVFGRLTVIVKLYENGKFTKKVRCQCSCGKVSDPWIVSLLAGTTKSCGCLNNEVRSITAKKRTRTYEKYKIVKPGAVFSRLTVLYREEKDGGLTSRVFCSCSCGKEVVVNIQRLLSGKTRSCGCLASELTVKRNKDTAKFDGFSSTHPKTFASWQDMMNRCTREYSTCYQDYGAKGVKVCSFIASDPRNLVKLIGIRKKALPSLDRFPIHNGNYSCGQCEECKANGWELNVRWATRKQQAENRGDFNVRLTAFGRTMILSQWEALSGIDARVISRRIKRGWDIERSLITPDSFGNCLKLPLTE